MNWKKYLIWRRTIRMENNYIDLVIHHFSQWDDINFHNLLLYKKKISKNNYYTTIINYDRMDTAGMTNSFHIILNIYLSLKYQTCVDKNSLYWTKKLGYINAYQWEWLENKIFGGLWPYLKSVLIKTPWKKCAEVVSLNSNLKKLINFYSFLINFYYDLFIWTISVKI